MTDTKAPIPTGKPIVYVREADPDGLPDELKDAPGRMYAVHDPSGKCLALAPDRTLAFVLARQNDMVPVSVH